MMKKKAAERKLGKKKRTSRTPDTDMDTWICPCPRQCRYALGWRGPLLSVFLEVGLVAPPPAFFFCWKEASLANAHARTLWAGGHPSCPFFLT